MRFVGDQGGRVSLSTNDIGQTKDYSLPLTFGSPGYFVPLAEYYAGNGAYAIRVSYNTNSSIRIVVDIVKGTSTDGTLFYCAVGKN